MKILYVAPENVSGGLELFAAGHRRRGNECRWVTFYKSRFEYEEDLCFNLRWMPNSNIIAHLRRIALGMKGRSETEPLSGNPPFYSPPDNFSKIFFALRDQLNSRRIYRMIDDQRLNSFDIYHFEQGIDPFRDGRWVKELKRQRKGIVSFYHGSDLRTRGVIRPVYEASDLHITSEIDLMHRIPEMKYLYLPLDTDRIKPVPKLPRKRVVVAHAARNRWYKGSDFIESTVKRLALSLPIEWRMIENVPYKRSLEIKADSDIFIDQLTDRGGWGYGASSVEALAMGLPTLTRINNETAAFLGDHPFVAVTESNLEERLSELVLSPDLRTELGNRGRDWVVKRHSLDSVMETLYGYYNEAGLI